VLSRPTTDQVLRQVASDLADLVLPHVDGEPARVAVQMMTQLLAGCAQRAAHELAWMHDEMAAIEAAVGDIDDDATQAALAAFRDAPAASLHLDDVAHRYHLASDALGAAVEHAYRVGDRVRSERLRDLLAARSATEMTIIGRLDLVGRG